MYAYGFRNPFRFTIDPVTNDLYVGDVGESTYEEVDELPYVAPGANFGWPEYEGNLQDPVAGADTCSTGPFAAPMFEYVHPPTIQSSVVCGPVVRPVPGIGFNFPPEYHGNLFVAEFYAGWIKRFVRGAGGWEIAAPAPGQKDFENWAIGLPFLSDLQTGPDGALYFMNFLNGNQARARAVSHHLYGVDRCRRAGEPAADRRFPQPDANRLGPDRALRGPTRNRRAPHFRPGRSTDPTGANPRRHSALGRFDARGGERRRRNLRLPTGNGFRPARLREAGPGPLNPPSQPRKTWRTQEIRLTSARNLRILMPP